MSLEFDFGPSIKDVKSSLPPVRPLKKLNSVNNGCKIRINLKFPVRFLSFFKEISKKLFSPKSPLDEIFINFPFFISQLI